MTSSGQGALFELVARGVKDSYFIKDAKESEFPYDPRYESSLPHLGERKTVVPVNGSAFGGTFEVELEKHGDVLTECFFEIDLPTWLPPLSLTSGGQPTDPSVANGLFPIVTADAGQDSYGYVPYVGYFLFESIQFYQDQFLLQEWTGDGLLAKQMTEGSWCSSFLDQTAGGGTSSSSVRDLQLRATPGRLRIKLPLPGTQCPKDGGFPLCLVPFQTFRIRATLRKLEDLVVCSDETKIKPAPWSVPSFQYTGSDAILQTIVPLERLKIGPPVVLLSTVQHYIPLDAQKALQQQVIEIPFRRSFENRFTFGELDFISLDKGGVSACTRLMDGRHPAERMIWFFRNTNVLDRNRLDDFTNDYFDTHVPSAAQPYPLVPGSFYYRLKLVIAGKDREHLLEPLVWNVMEAHAKAEKANGKGIGAMSWGLGDRYGQIYPAPRQPEGTVNWSTADRPTLYVELANVTSNPLLGQRNVELRVVLESWNMYVIREGRGSIGFAS